MSKIVYHCLSYPDSSDIEEIKSALDAREWDYCISPLHDKDVYKDTTENHKEGDFKKAHYHIMVGFAKSPPDYKTWSQSMRDLGCVPPPTGSQGIVQDPETEQEYFDHTDDKSLSDPSKATYNPDDRVFSVNWNVQKYITYLDKRKSKKDDSSSDISFIYSAIIDNDISDFNSLFLFIQKNQPSLLSVVSSRAYCFNTILRERRMKKLDFSNERIERLMELNDDLQRACDKYQNDLTFCLSCARILYQRKTGETVTPDMDDLCKILSYLSSVTEL